MGDPSILEDLLPAHGEETAARDQNGTWPNAKRPGTSPESVIGVMNAWMYPPADEDVAVAGHAVEERQILRHVVPGRLFQFHARR